MVRTLSAVLAIAALVGGGTARGEFADLRALFVSRFEYSTNASSINAVINNAADMGITDVMFQVRGKGDAYYDSQFEPRAAAVPAGFDPLQTAITAAHARGVKLHAWINATPMWQNNVGDPPPGHIYYNDNPSFRLFDINGNPEPFTGWSNYSSVNPVLPEVHQHLNNVVNDISTNYAVDGVHLDYIRYLPGANNAAADFAQMPHDPIAHAMFQAATGLDASQQSNFTAYKNYVKGRITDLVASLKGTVDAAEVSTGRTMELTASVWRDPDIGENDYMQDYRTWLEQDLLDVAMPMIYLSSSNDNLFNPNLLNSLNIPSNSRVAPVLGAYLHDEDSGGVELTISQLERAYNFGADGVAFFSYPSFFNSGNPLSAQRRTAVEAFFDSIENPPPPPPGGVGNVLDDFEVDEGHFHWPYTQSPVTQTFGLTADTTIDRVTGEAQTGEGAQLLELVTTGAAWQLRHNSGLAQVAHPNGNVPLEPTGNVGFWLKTANAGVTVRISIDDPTTTAGSTALERSIALDVTGDDQWHLYQWALEDAAQWDAFAGGADGDIDAFLGTVSIDSIWLAGTGDAQLYLDNVSHNPEGALTASPLPGDFNGDGDVNQTDFAAWQSGFGNPADAELADGDSDADGDVDGQDFLAWQRGFDGSTPEAEATGTPVPEPTAAWLAVGLVAGLMVLAALERRRLARSR